MDLESRRMLADLGIATRDSIVTSVTGKDEQEAALRSNKLRNVRVTSSNTAIQNKWKVLRLNDKPQDNDGRDAYVATAPPVASNGRPSEGIAPRSIPALGMSDARETKSKLGLADSRHSPNKNRSSANDVKLPKQPTVKQASGPSSTQLSAQNLKLYKTMAEYFAARPSPMADSYYIQYPERQVHLEQARIDIAKTMIELIKSPASDETKRYLAFHPDRQWMFDVTLKAMKDAGSASEAVCSFYDAHPECKPFCLVAQEGRRRELNKNRQASNVPATITEVKPAGGSNAQQADGQDLPAEAMTPTPLSSNSKTAADSTNMSSAKPIASLPPSPKAVLGSLDASFYDTLGNLIGHHQATVRIPIQATIKLTAKADLLSPTEVIAMMDSLACAMDTTRRQVMQGAYDDGSGLYDVDDMLTALHKMDLNKCCA